MKILIAGDWHSELHEEAVFHAFQQLGHEVLRFAWHQYFKPAGVWGRLALPLLKAQNKYLAGPAVSRLNRDMLERAAAERPDLLFVYRGSHITPETLRAIRSVSPRTIIAGYNNDDPFSPHCPKWQWRHFLAGIPEYDVVFSYRPQNVKDYEAAGAKRVELLRSWFIPERNRPVELNDEDRKRYACDVVFVGHYEDDERIDHLKAIVKAGYKLRLWGPGYDWDPVIRRIPELRGLAPVTLVWGEDYNKALCGAKMALSFFSKLNRDTYTRRSFEIPASGVFMLSAYTKDMESLFVPGQEAEYFASPEEMLRKLGVYLADDEKRERVARNGHAKVLSGGHDVRSRMSTLLSTVQGLREDVARA